jgi:hypothetical protein
VTKQLRLRAEGVAWREVDGEVIALGLDSSTYFGTNASGSLLWRRLAEGATRNDLIGSLMEAFDLDEERAIADVDAFVDDLRARGLLEP